MRPDSESYLIRSLKLSHDHDIITGSVNGLGDHNVISSGRDKDGLSITIDRKPSSDKPICFKIEII